MEHFSNGTDVAQESRDTNETPRVFAWSHYGEVGDASTSLELREAVHLKTWPYLSGNPATLPPTALSRFKADLKQS